MFSAQNKLYIKLATSSLGVAFLLVNPTSVLAADTTVGEFLYNDSSLPDTGATCTLNVKNPDGTALLSSQSLTATSDGWYGYSFTSPTTVGYYRSEICCDTGGDHMCIDKSFSISPEASSGGSSLSANDIASAVWGYSGRTLTGFNNIVADVWSYATRTLTSGANITNVTNITTNDITQIKNTSTETRLLLEQLVNKPIVENSLTDVKDLDLSDRIKTSKTIANEINMNLSFVDTTVAKTNKDWNKLTDRQILDNLSDTKNIIGNETDSSSTDSLFGRINFIRDTWGLKESDSLHEELKAIAETISFIQTGISSYGKSPALLKEMSGAKAYILSSQKDLSLLSKKLDDADTLSSVIDSNLSRVNNILGAWTSQSYLSYKNDIDVLTKDTVAINKIPKGELVLEPSYSDVSGEKKLKNKVLGIQALLFANKKMLVAGPKVALLSNWLEEGSVVIKTLITNPSTLISQTVPLKYYLPKEVKKENIIDSDAGTAISYDTEKDQLYVEGSFNLKPGETRTVKVRIEDVWQISVAEIDSLLKQTDELSKPLEKTAFFAQGITLKSDIEVSLNKAKDLVNDGTTPESKIKSYREAELEIVSAKDKIEKLKDMVSQAQTSGSILGFVGGSQAIGVWGIVIAIATGFVFMTVYMRKLMNTAEVVKERAGIKKVSHFDKLAVFLVVATISGLMSSIGVKKFVIPQVYAKQERQVLGASTIDYKRLKIVDLVSDSGVVKTYGDEGTTAVLEIVDSGKNAVEVERGEKRVKVVFDQKEVWVEAKNVVSE